MKKTLSLLVLSSALFLTTACSGDSERIQHAQFEMQQGNTASAKKYLEAIPADSPERAKADSLLKLMSTQP